MSLLLLLRWRGGVAPPRSTTTFDASSGTPGTPEYDASAPSGQGYDGGIPRAASAVFDASGPEN